MTDEERAEEYAKGKAHEHYHFLFEENNGSPVDFAKLCHLDGLVEGRKLGKEEQWKATEKAQKKTSARIRELKNEIEELKALHESDKKATALLMQKWEEDRNELKAHCKAVDEVNEKMKCCGNCKKERNKPEPLSVHISCAKITANGS